MMKPITATRPTADRLVLRTDFDLVVVVEFAKLPTVLAFGCRECEKPVRIVGNQTSCMTCRKRFPASGPSVVVLDSPQEREVLAEWASAVPGGPDPLTAILLANDLLRQVEKGKNSYLSALRQEEQRKEREAVKLAQRLHGYSKKQARHHVAMQKRLKRPLSF